MRFLRALRRQAWLIAVCLAAGLGAAAILLGMQQPVYRASTKIVVGQGGGILDPANSGSVDPLVQTMANLLKSDVVARRVIQDLGLSMEPRDLLRHLDVSTRPQTAVLAVRYDSPDKAEAVAILRETGSVFTALVSRLGSVQPTKPADGATTAPLPVTARTFDPAHLEPGSVGPSALTTLLIAGALAALVGAALAFAREILSPRIDSREQAEEWFQAPVVATLPKHTLENPPPAVSGHSRRGSALVRALGLLIGQLQIHRGADGMVIFVTSATDRESKGMVVAHLGTALAGVADEVICVEADPAAPAVGRHLGVDGNASQTGRYGLVDVVQGRVEPESALHTVGTAASVEDAGGPEHPAEAKSTRKGVRTAAPSLRLLPAASWHSTDMLALDYETLVSLTKRLAGRDRYVIVDAPPVHVSGEAVPLAAASDAIVVVATVGSTTKANAEAVRRILGPIEEVRVYILLCHPPSMRRRIWSRMEAFRRRETEAEAERAGTASATTASRSEARSRTARSAPTRAGTRSRTRRSRGQA